VSLVAEKVISVSNEYVNFRLVISFEENSEHDASELAA
jgi:hypothetical protein